jgi:hypothetical protein
MNKNTHQEIIPAFNDSPSEFDLALPFSPKSIIKIPKRLNINGKIIPLDNQDEYAIHIYITVFAALNSEWFQSLTTRSQQSISSAISFFIIWLNNQTINNLNRYLILKEYEAYRVNECRVKPQSTGLRNIVGLLNQGKHNEQMTNETVQYIHLLLRSTSFSISDEPQPETISSYFASMPWLRGVLGENDYLKLESPKRLMSSFSIVVATMLLFILDAKKDAIKCLKNPKKLNHVKNKFHGKRDQGQFYCLTLLQNLGVLTESMQPSDNLTELILLDCVPTNLRKKALEIWYKLDNKIIEYRTSIFNPQIFTNPCIFSPDLWPFPTAIEQILFTWLCAWQAIQPSDIYKLKRKDFIITKNHLGRPIALQCSYYKGRSSRHSHEPPMIDASSIEGQALLGYLALIPSDGIRLTFGSSERPTKITFAPYSIFSRLIRLFKSQIIQNNINKNLIQRKSSPIFLRALTSMSSEESSSHSSWVKLQIKNGLDSSINKYRLDTSQPFPILLFGLNSIKNSSVHARTDSYRDSDLINMNSHTAQTEKANYLTDANQEWVNQNGRITRMVLNDIDRYVYQPNMNAAHNAAQELILRTRVIQAIPGSIEDHAAIQINSLESNHNSTLTQGISDIDYSDILVLDTPETVVYMLHYINEAERQQQALITHALPFFERTILPRVEWMESVMRNQLSPSVTRIGNTTYEEIRSILPKLFGNELHGGVGS